MIPQAWQLQAIPALRIQAGARAIVAIFDVSVVAVLDAEMGEAVEPLVMDPLRQTFRRPLGERP